MTVIASLPWCIGTAATRNKLGRRGSRNKIQIEENHEKRAIGRLSRDINGGWEMRYIECVCQFHTPTIATKRIVRQDTGEVVRECAMEKDELQENLFDGDSAAAIHAFFPANKRVEAQV